MLARSTAAPHVLLCHGLWMPALAMVSLAHHFHRQGWVPTLFQYSTTRDSWPQTLDRLAQAIEQAGETGQPVHLVGHSLGGLLAVNHLQSVGPLPNGGRAVCLGSPLRGSHTARQLARHPWGRQALGKAWAWLDAGVPSCPTHTPVAMVAGTHATGAGRMLEHLWRLGSVSGHLEPAHDTAPTGPNDGTVWVSETEVDGLAHRVQVPCTHTGLTWDTQVAALCSTFLGG